MAGLMQMKDMFKAGDVVVVIFHDHGTRYLGKMFNDDWMRDRGFLEDTKPKALDLIASHKYELLCRAINVAAPSLLPPPDEPPHSCRAPP